MMKSAEGGVPGGGGTHPRRWSASGEGSAVSPASHPSVCGYGAGCGCGASFPSLFVPTGRRRDDDGKPASRWSTSFSVSPPTTLC
uniref:Uncharacterized protein n=1 Tax=Oryza meridionalis TaxID=40149 RepID=A0A0E0F9I1_9ORYZ